MKREQAVLWVMLATVLVIVVAWRGSGGGSGSSALDEAVLGEPVPAPLGEGATRALPLAHEPASADAPPAREETPEPAAPPKPKKKRGEQRVPWHARVVDALTHEPVVGATLVPREARQPIAPLGTSGDDGRFAPLDVDGQILRILRPGYSEALVWIQRGHETLEGELVIALAEAAALAVTVEDAAGDTLVGATIRARADELALLVHRDDERARRALTDAGAGTVQWTAPIDPDGACVLDGVAAGVALELELVARDGHVRVWPERPELRPGEHRPMAWVIGQGCRVAGTALDADGAPAEGLELVLRGEENSGAELRTTTDVDGRFVFEDVLPASWWIDIAGSRRFVARALPVEIVAGESEKAVEFPVARGLFLRGTVVGSDGRPAAGCLVGARQGALGGQRWEDESDARGAFEIGPLAAGEYRLRAERWKSGATLAAASPEVEVVAGAEGLLLALEPRETR